MTHVWRFVLDDRFLELRTRSVSHRERKADEVHEDVAFMSRDTDRGAFVFPGWSCWFWRSRVDTGRSNLIAALDHRLAGSPLA